MLYLGRKGIGGSHITSVGYSGISVSAPSGETLIEEYTLTLGDIKVDLTTGASGTGMLFDSAASPLDLSIYAGNDTDMTTHRMEIEDSTGKVASFFVGAAGGGEALSAELITGWTSAEGPNTFETFVSSGKSITSAINSVDAGRCKTNDIDFLNKIIKYNRNLTVNSGGTPSFRVSTPSFTQVTAFILATEGFFTPFINPPNTPTNMMFSTTSVTDFSADPTVKVLTDVPITGVHAITERNGNVRGFTEIETGFAPNAITKVRVYEL